MNDIRTTILEKIHSGEIAMQPRWHFMLRAALLVIAAAIMLSIVVYLASFVMFALHKSGLVFAPLFGMRGLMLFVTMSPWFLISLTAMFLLVLYVLVTHFAWSYRRPLVYSMLGVVCAVIGISSVIQHVAMHERLERYAEEYKLPGMHPFYQSLGGRPDGVTLGSVLGPVNDGCEMETDRKEVVLIITTKETKLPPREYCVDGRLLLVFGPREAERITAFGIREVDEDYVPMPMKMRHLRIIDTADMPDGDEDDDDRSR